jgi:hypothetical protein
MANMGLKSGPRQLYFTAALAVAAVNSVVAVRPSHSSSGSH